MINHNHIGIAFYLNNVHLEVRLVIGEECGYLFDDHIIVPDVMRKIWIDQTEVELSQVYDNEGSSGFAYVPFVYTKRTPTL